MKASPTATSYFDWRIRNEDVNGEPIQLVTKPGQTGHHSTLYPEFLLAEHAACAATDVVVNLECGAGLAGLVAARRAANGQVILASPNLADVLAARQSILFAGLTNVRVVHSSGVGVVEDRSVDIVVARNPKGRLPSLRTILAGYRMLRPGGRFYLAGAGDEGIQSSLARVERLFGSVQTLAYRKGCRIGLAIRPDRDFTLPNEFAVPVIRDNAFSRYEVTIDRGDFVVCSRPGVFSGDGLDPGAAALIEATRINGAERVLDLGCGTGIVGAVAASHGHPLTVYQVDVDSDAIASAEETARASGVAGTTILASDSIAAVADQRFDVVLANPPYHFGRETDFDVAHEFIRGSAAVLDSRGRAYLVANRFLPYEPAMSEHFAAVETVYLGSKFKVLLGRQPRQR